MAAGTDRGRSLVPIPFCHLASLVFTIPFLAQAATKLDVTTNPRAFIRLETECEKLKKQMSANTTDLPLNIECLMDEKDFSSKLNRAEFEELIAPQLKRIQDTVSRFVTSIQDLDINPKELDAMEVVGGSTRIPFVRDILSKAFDLPLSTTLNCDEAVARGCALMGAMISPTFRVREFKVSLRRACFVPQSSTPFHSSAWVTVAVSFEIRLRTPSPTALL